MLLIAVAVVMMVRAGRWSIAGAAPMVVLRKMFGGMMMMMTVDVVVGAAAGVILQRNIGILFAPAAWGGRIGSSFGSWRLLPLGHRWMRLRWRRRICIGMFRGTRWPLQRRLMRRLLADAIQKQFFLWKNIVDIGRLAVGRQWRRH